MAQRCHGRTPLNGASHSLMLGNSIADVVHSWGLTRYGADITTETKNPKEFRKNWALNICGQETTFPYRKWERPERDTPIL